MKFKFNNKDFKVTEYENGKIITELKTFESYYLDEDSSQFITPLINNWVHIDQLINEDVEMLNLNEFISTLVEKNILFFKE